MSNCGDQIRHPIFSPMVLHQCSAEMNITNMMLLEGKIYGGAYGVGYHRKDLALHTLWSAKKSKSCWLCSSSYPGSGTSWKDRADVWLFFVNFFVTFCTSVEFWISALWPCPKRGNTIFNLGLTCYSVCLRQIRRPFLQSWKTWPSQSRRDLASLGSLQRRQEGLSLG